MAPATPGMIVMFIQPDSEPPQNGHRNHPAIVTRVNDDQGVNLNLTVFFDGTDPAPQTSVLPEGYEGVTSDHPQWRHLDKPATARSSPTRIGPGTP